MSKFEAIGKFAVSFLVGPAIGGLGAGVIDGFLGTSIPMIYAVGGGIVATFSVINYYW